MENVLNIIKNSCKEISNIIRNSNSLNLSEVNEKYNISGDNVKKLDLISNEILKNNLSKCPNVRSIGSEEEDKLIETTFTNGDYLVCFDPLDGSSNIGVNITTGTIFAIYKYVNNEIKDGNNILVAGYCLYGGSTQLVVANNKINIYQLNNNNFELIKSDWKIPNKGNYYSINESNKYKWTTNKYDKLINKLIQKNYSARWVGSLVADGHRTLIKGGFFTYPGNKTNPYGKIRLLYEAYPFAYIFKIGGGESSNGSINLLDVLYPKDIHQKTPIILSSKYEFEL